MPVTAIAGHDIHVDDEGFLTVYEEWTEDLAALLAEQIGIVSGYGLECRAAYG